MSVYQKESNTFLGRTILVVDDNVDNLRVISQCLKESDYRILTAKDGKSALEKAQGGQPDLILLDVMMPTMDGFETCRRLKANKTLQNIPVIFMTALGGIDEKVKGFKLGAVDYITKPFQAEEVLARVQTHLSLRELTEQLETQALELAAAKEQAEAANASKGDFLARMSHEIRTPLNAVTGFTHIVLKSELTDEQRIYLNKVQLASNNLMDVINDILDFSKVEAGQLELTIKPFDLDQVLEDQAALFSDRLAQKDLRLDFSVTSQVPRQLSGDATRLTQMLTNLIGNAVKFTATGKIKVGVDIDDGAPREHRKAVLKFSVKDTGVGIGADVLPTLFEPFIQADGTLTSNHEGSGLGLAICQQLAELMGGRIWAKSTVGKGSTFFFTAKLDTQIEQLEAFSPDQIKAPAPLSPPHLEGRRVLIVEDSEMNREVAIALLKETGVTVETAENGRVAVDKVTHSPKHHYDAVFMDIQMPVMDGYEATRRIRELETPDQFTARRLPIIALTGHALKGEKEKYLAADMDDYLPKPIHIEELYQLLDKWIASA